MPNENRRDGLEVYLRDHYAAGIGALELLEHLAKVHQEDALGAFFTQLHADVQSDHQELHDLINALGFAESSVRDAGAWMAEKLSRAKVVLSGGDAKLGLLQALETLYIGVTGKRLLWRVLAQSRDSLKLSEIDLEHLQERAVDQAERLETQRLVVAPAALGAS